MGKPPKSVLGRSAELVKLAARMGFEYKSGQLEEIKILVESLAGLKGAAMKIGHLLSMDFADLCPPEVRVVLEQLQASSPHFLPIDEIEKILQDELGPYYSSISNLSPEPIAAASIGQVHTASFQDKKIVLKVQYPGIANCIDSDVNILRTITKTLLTLTGKKMDIDPLFTEMKKVFCGETNYLNELDNLKKYRKNFSNYSAYSVPIPIEELSSAKVLAMSFEEGISLNKWNKQNNDIKRSTEI